jgi:ATP-dependent DNA helicase PIF1
MTTEVKEKMDLTLGQQKAIDLILAGQSIFLTGPSGTGKSFIISYITEKLGYKKKIAVCSTTGISAFQLQGTTLHSFFGIGLGQDSTDDMYDNIVKYKKYRERWQSIDILIIDEISMLNPDLFDKLEEIARRLAALRKNIRPNIDDIPPFGGIQLLLCGDFLQLPVVNCDNFCFEAKTWNKCIKHVVDLTEIVRQKDVEFQIILNELRYGHVSKKGKKILNSRVGVELKNELNIKPIELYTTNIDVDRVNMIELNALYKKYKMPFYVYEMDFEIFDLKLDLNKTKEKCCKSCNAQEEVKLCLHAQVILIKNLDIPAGLVNGSKGVIVDFIEEYPEVQFLTGIRKVITPETWSFKENKKIFASITQVPLRLAWATSIHKSQGLTLDCVNINLEKTFEYGQAYVAISRVRTLEGLSITSIDYHKIKAHPKAVRFYRKLYNEPVEIEDDSEPS